MPAKEQLTITLTPEVAAAFEEYHLEHGGTKSACGLRLIAAGLELDPPQLQHGGKRATASTPDQDAGNDNKEKL